MTSVKVEFHRLAEKEYDEAYRWYLERSPRTALRFKEAVEDAVGRIPKRLDATACSLEPGVRLQGTYPLAKP